MTPIPVTVVIPVSLPASSATALADHARAVQDAHYWILLRS
jgi:hypothetical protein